MHHNSKDCDSNQLVSKVQSVIRNAELTGQLFSKRLEVAAIYDEDASEIVGKIPTSSLRWSVNL